MKLFLFVSFLFSAPLMAEMNYLKKAQSIEKAGYFFEAINWYQEVIARDPRNYKALVKQAQLYYKIGKKKNALDVMAKSLKLNPFHVESNFFMGVMLVNSKEYKRAVGYLETAKNLRPKLFEIYPHMAKAYESMGKIQKTKNTFNIMLSLRPKKPWIYREYARYLKRIGHYKFAREQYKDALKLIPKDFKYRYEYALFLQKHLDDFDEALVEYQKVLNLNKNHQLARYEFARIYEQLKQYDDAIKNYTFLLKKYPQYINPYIRLGVIERKKGRFSSSLNFFSKAEKIDKKNIKVLEEKALIYVKMKQYDKAAKEYYLLTSYYPKYSRPYIFRGWLFELIGLTGKAEKEYRYAIKLNPKDTDARLYLGMMYLTEEKVKKSKQAFQKILEIDEGNGQARYQLSQIYYKKGEYQLANYHFSKMNIGSAVYVKSKMAREQTLKYLSNDKKRLPASSKGNKR